MKLISKTLIYYLMVSLPLLIVAGVFSYYVIKDELKDGADDALIREAENAKHFLKDVQSNQPFTISLDSLSFIVLTDKDKPETNFFEENILDKDDDKEYLNYRGVRYYTTYNDQNYLITILKPTIDQEELMEGIVSSFEIIIFFLVLAFFIVNWFVSKTLWKPFYNTLSKLNTYDLKKHSLAHFESSSTKEFRQLNETLNLMTDKIYSDYIQQKEFTENASHEMQTPLAVVKANVSLLMQSPNLKEEEMNQVQVIENTLKKLSALNKTLILLTRIENNQFQDDSIINLNDVVNKTLVNYSDLLEVRSISVKNNTGIDLNVKMNAALADILVSNLIQNAIRHNKDKGEISISITEKTIAIENTGEALKVNEQDLFVRFKKNDASKDSLGLGLSIVKSIVDRYNASIDYKYQNEFHKFSIQFK